MELGRPSKAVCPTSISNIGVGACHRVLWLTPPIFLCVGGARMCFLIILSQWAKIIRSLDGWHGTKAIIMPIYLTRCILAYRLTVDVRSSPHRCLWGCYIASLICISFILVHSGECHTRLCPWPWWCTLRSNNHGETACVRIAYSAFA